jgi:hypothetical protein
MKVHPYEKVTLIAEHKKWNTVFWSIVVNGFKDYNNLVPMATPDYMVDLTSKDQEDHLLTNNLPTWMT